MHKQQTCVAYKWADSLCRHLCLAGTAYAQMS